MSYLISIDAKKRIILRPQVVHLKPELGALDEKELLTIILIYDNFSLLRKYNEGDRIRRAVLWVYEDNNPKLLSVLESKQPNHRITNAVNAYRALQYDPKVDLAAKYQDKIDSLQELLQTENGPTAIKNILGSISELRKSKRELENEIADEVIEQGKLQGDQENSLIEVWQKNDKAYQAMFSKRPLKSEV